MAGVESGHLLGESMIQLPRVEMEAPRQLKRSLSRLCCGFFFFGHVRVHECQCGHMFMQAPVSEANFWHLWLTQAPQQICPSTPSSSWPDPADRRHERSRHHAPWTSELVVARSRGRQNHHQAKFTLNLLVCFRGNFNTRMSSKTTEHCQ